MATEPGRADPGADGPTATGQDGAEEQQGKPGGGPAVEGGSEPGEPLAWDGNLVRGCHHLLLGDPHGYLKVYRNVGSPGHPRLAAPVPFGDFCDVDGDGRLDLITADNAPWRPGARTYPGRVWWQRNEGTPTLPRLGPRQLLTSIEDWGPGLGLDAADFDGTGRPGLLLAAKLPAVNGLPYRTAVWYFPRRPAPGR